TTGCTTRNLNPWEHMVPVVEKSSSNGERRLTRRTTTGADCSRPTAAGYRGSPEADIRAMKLQDALKTSLDELRMQMLGGQVLFGFQFQVMFQDNFRAVPHSGRVVYALGLALMIAVTGLLIAVPCQHRLVDGGETTLRIYGVR